MDITQIMYIYFNINITFGRENDERLIGFWYNQV